MRRQVITEIICGIFISLFVYTAISKLVNIDSFKSTLQLSPVIGTKNELIAWSLLVTELIIAALLFIPRSRLAGLYASVFLMLIFTGYISYLLAFKYDQLPCSCGGVLQQMSWQQHLVFNIFFTLLSLSGILLQKNSTFYCNKQAKPKTCINE